MQSDPKQIADLMAVNELIERDLLLFSYDQSPSQIIVFDAEDLRIVSANEVALKALKTEMRALQKLDICALVPNLSKARIDRILARLSRRASGWLSLVIYDSTGDRAPVEVQLRFVAGKKRSFIVTIKPMRSLQAIAKKAALAEERLNVAIEALSDGFVFYDKNDRLVVCNQSYRDIYSESAPAIAKGATFEEIVRYGLERDQYSLGFNTKEAWLARRLSEHKNCNPLSEQRLADGRWLRIVERETSDGGRVGLRVDITNQKLHETELRRQSRSDELTGLLNRRGFTQKLELLSAGLLDGEKLVIFLIDLDRFKSVNDVYGHEAGNLLLRECSERLNAFRPQLDAVSRIGADEFAIALHGTFDDDGMLRVAGQLIKLMNEPIHYKEQNLQVGASIGISWICIDSSSRIEEQITASDIALSEAKREGGNFAVLFTPRMREEIVANIEVSKDIRRGLELGEFRPFFQPQIDTSSNRVIGFEALIRWQHPTKGLVPAFQFLEVAQRVGLTESLDDLVMDKSVEAVRTMLDWGFEDACVSINLSIAQISDPRILRRLQTCLDRHRIEPDHIRLELLESTLLDDRASVIVSNVHKLIRAGFEVELDDFGTGHAAIATLRKFEVSRIKVDRSLVTHIDSDPELQVITSALIDLVQNLGIDALAEGVETEGEQKKLWEMGCFVAQGYLHARPMPLETIRTWLEDRGDIPKSGSAKIA